MLDSVNQAVILAGGKGERLRPLTNHLPKPLAPVNGRPFLDYLLRSLIDEGIKKILILNGYKGELISDPYQDSLCDKFPVVYSNSGPNSNTGKRLADAYDKLDDFFILVYVPQEDFKNVLVSCGMMTK